MLNFRFGTLAGLLWWIATSGMTCLPVALTGGCASTNKEPLTFEQQLQKTKQVFDLAQQSGAAAAVTITGNGDLFSVGVENRVSIRSGFAGSATLIYCPKQQPNMSSGLPALPEEWAQAVDGTLSAINRRLDALDAPKTPTP